MTVVRIFFLKLVADLQTAISVYRFLLFSFLLVRLKRCRQIINCSRSSKNLKGIYFFFEIRMLIFFQEGHCFFLCLPAFITLFQSSFGCFFLPVKTDFSLSQDYF